MRTAVPIFFLCAFLVGLAGCSNGGKTDGEVVPPKAAKAATIADEIAANPDSAEEILKNHGMTRAEFEALMYEIAEDEALSASYERARKR
jgi:hypothetical protein